MVRKDLLKGWIADNHMTLRQVAGCLGMTSRTLYSRMRRGNFRLAEMERLIAALHITNPCEVFFDMEQKETKGEGTRV